MSLVGVSYFAIIPDMIRDYVDRSSLNIYRVAGGLVAIFLAIWFQPIIQGKSADHGAFMTVVVGLSVILALPWIGVFWVTQEPLYDAVQAHRASFWRDAVFIFRQGAFRRLVGFYLSARMASDFFAGVLLYYLTYFLGRGMLFPIVLTSFFAVALLFLPLVNWASRRLDKRYIAGLGNATWVAVFLIAATLPASTPSWVVVLVLSCGGLGFVTVDVMPWAMLGEVIDEGELIWYRRAEGIYSGLFLFLRKLAGAVALLTLGVTLAATGYDATSHHVEAGTLQSIRFLCMIVPAILLSVATYFCISYPITKIAHAAIRTELTDRASAP